MALIPLGILSSGGGVASLIAAYFAGGNTGATRYSSVDKFSFPSDTRSALGTGLSFAVEGVTGMANSGVAGYAAGGDAGGSGGSGIKTTVDKFAFPSDTKTTLGTGLSVERTQAAGFSNAGVAGYILQGSTVAGLSNTGDKFAFPSDTRSTLTSLGSNFGGAGIYNNTVAGYRSGGANAAFTTFVQAISKTAFPSDTGSTITATLSSRRFAPSGMSNSGTAGYFAGGGTGNGDGGSVFAATTVDKITYSTEARTTLATGLSSARYWLAATEQTGTAGYVGGGAGGSTTVDKFAYPSDTRTTLGTGLSVGRSAPGAFANQG